MIDVDALIHESEPVLFQVPLFEVPFYIQANLCYFRSRMESKITQVRLHANLCYFRSHYSKCRFT